MKINHKRLLDDDSYNLVICLINMAAKLHCETFSITVAPIIELLSINHLKQLDFFEFLIHFLEILGKECDELKIRNFFFLERFW